ncbi:ATP-dependent helicase HrpB [Catenuloplanes atrovinosus]|uniref:ATP-dependent helicase HrpB n=1 Tax=Catenuloplanes atrovinosus TaxID=137266 RepID=A0AAE3YJ19_9ACTN|nr:ATP-dependent helicase HrpB [Catenuloplanes atrovinosus]MDR7273832.1 ATP-dependent helicase HrpB [Catenuloplanes atrovinosus]
MTGWRDTGLPVEEVLESLISTLAGHGAAVLVAPPGTGKTTVVPPALAFSAAAAGGRVIVAEPRRVAARAAARRMAALLGEPVGETVGYTVRGDRRTGPRTRVEVVTTGVLVARLQRDPELPGTAALILDECHERHLDSDLALAFAADVRANLRPDLLVLATSATAEADRIARCLASPAAPVVTATAAVHPVEVVWAPPERPIPPPHGMRVEPRFLDHVAAVVRRALADSHGDLLVFLPGAGEIGAVAGRLSGLRDDADLITLHGRQDSGAQDAALRPGPRRRVVLASAVAESSLTVPGVRVVVDAGLSRVPRMDLSRGLGSLATVRVSRASATQRAGRAGREAPGRVYRCWAEAEHERLPAFPAPEIVAADLTGFALELACWGAPDGTGLALPDPPPAAAMEVATATLRALGAVGADGRVTPRGRAMSRVGAHPRLARALLDGAAAVGADRAAEVVALLADDTLTGRRDDLAAVWRALRSGADPAASGRWRAESRRLRAAVTGDGPDGGRPGGRRPADDLAAGLVAGLAYPEWLARARRTDGGGYLMAGGTAAELADGSALAGSPWLAIAAADRAAGRANARVRLAAVIDEATAREAGAPLLSAGDEVAWDGDEVRARHVERLGALVLRERAPARPDPALIAAALREALADRGLTGTLTWGREATALRERLAFCRAALGEPWPDVSDDALLARLDEWLGPELAGARRLGDLRRADLSAALRRLLPWREAARLDEVAPERVTVPSGSRVRLDYADPAAPVLAVKVQEAFGWARAPRVADGRVEVVLHLLSPAGRPVAVTRDLPSFWANGYPQVRAELRGRYPRHPWPEDPTTAPPTRRTQPRRS